MADDKKPTPHPFWDAEKSWKKATKISDEMTSLSKVIQKDAMNLVFNMDKFIELSKQLFVTLPQKDILHLNDSPINPFNFMNALFTFMSRCEGKDRNFLRVTKLNIFTDFGKVPDFTDVVKDGIKWAFKMESQKPSNPEKQKPDLQSIT